MIYLYNELADQFGAEHNINVRSVEELMRAMDANCPGFRRAIIKDKRYRITKDGEDLSPHQALIKYDANDWHLTPLVEGAGGEEGGPIQFFLGAVLVVAGEYSGQGWLTNIGVALIMSGIAQMLCPAIPDDASGDVDERASFLFNGPRNSIESGMARPLLFGTFHCGSVIASFGLEVSDQI